jgi:hypothetical protein
MDLKEFKYLDFSKEAEKYLKEITPPKAIVVSSSKITYRKPLITKFKKFTVDDLQIIDALRVIKKQFFPFLKRNKDIRISVELKALWGNIDEIDSSRVKFYIGKFKTKFKYEQQRLLDEAFGA